MRYKDQRGTPGDCHREFRATKGTAIFDILKKTLRSWTARFMSLL